MNDTLAICFYILIWVIFLGFASFLSIKLKSCNPLWILIIPAMIKFSVKSDDCNSNKANQEILGQSKLTTK